MKNKITVIQRGGFPMSPAFVAIINGKEVGWANFRKNDDQKPFCAEVIVEEEFRRNGIMEAIYTEAAIYFGEEIVPSTELTPESAAYWKKKGVPLPDGARILSWEERLGRGDNLTI